MARVVLQRILLAQRERLKEQTADTQGKEDREVGLVVGTFVMLKLGVSVSGIAEVDSVGV
jgi:hypothetical protein